VRVRIVTQEERQKLPLTEVIEEVAVERVPVNRYVSERSGPREEGDVVIIPVFEIVPVVEERLLLKEEVHLHRRRREVRHEAEMVLRTETPIVERRMPGQEEWNEDHPDR
jgi:stress response protein YsnF